MSEEERRRQKGRLETRAEIKRGERPLNHFYESETDIKEEIVGWGKSEKTYYAQLLKDPWQPSHFCLLNSS